VIYDYTGDFSTILGLLLL